MARSSEVRLAVLEAKQKAVSRALKLQAKDYDRRLDELNHAHVRATEDRNKFVTGELFYAKLDELQKWRTESDKWRSKAIGIAIGMGALSGIVGELFMKLVIK